MPNKSTTVDSDVVTAAMQSNRTFIIHQPHKTTSVEQETASIADQVLESLSVIANYSDACQLILQSSDLANRAEAVAWLATITDRAHGIADAVRASNRSSSTM